jgi:hypothetical protein
MVMIRLYHFLFENTQQTVFINALKTFMEKNPDSILTNAIGDPQEFYEANKNKIDGILSDTTNFSFLGAGMNGAAFNLGDRVLKLQQQDIRAKKILKTYSGKEKKGLHYPMIYDHGTLIAPTTKKSIDYTVLEKFETSFVKDPDIRWLIDRLVLTTNMKITQQNPATKKPYTQDELKETIKNSILNNERASEIYPKLTEKLRLKADWLERLIEDMVALQNEEILDSVGANLGVRRLGSEGYLVFFD